MLESPQFMNLMSQGMYRGWNKYGMICYIITQYEMIQYSVVLDYIIGYNGIK